MKKMSYLKRQSKLIIGIFIGVILMGGVSYAVGSFTSESVSYTRNGQTMNVKQALDDLIGKAVKVDDLEEKAKVYKYAYLADVVKEGDFVNYNAGTWDKTLGKPTEQGQFGGYKANTSKNTSVACYKDALSKYQGRRVLETNTSTKTVTIIHAGQPECYYHSIKEDSYPSESIRLLNERANQYKNSYAISARSITKEDVEKLAGTNDLRQTNTLYWLANESNEYASDNRLLYLNPTGNTVILPHGELAFGIRPIIVLKSSVLTTGKGIDEFGQEAWILA